MGRATVISGGTDGRYVIEMDYGLAQRDARVAKLDALLSELDDRKTWQQGQVDGFQGGLDSFAPEMDALIVEYVALSNAAPQDAAAIAAKRKQIDAKTAEIIKQQLWLGQAKNALAQTDLEIKQATLIRAALMALEITEQRPAWCADLTEDAAGEVATIEVPGESALILIAPQAPAPVAADGVLTAREIQSPAQVYWNAAVLPGWQKFKPTYRWGTITALDDAADTASVALAPAVSSAQALDVNQAETLTDIPVEYMECNAAVFTVGDNVIVGFTGQDWAQPRVIGFLDNPKACATVFSGVIKRGEVITLPGPPSSTTLRAYRPTANAWQYPLRADPAKSPDVFNDEPKLGQAGNQYADILPSMYSGQMAKVVQLVMGRGSVLHYSSGWSVCHGVLTGAGGVPWLIEISAANGVLAMRLPMSNAPTSSPVHAVAQALADFGGLPTGGAMPTGAQLADAIASGSVVQLLSAGAMAPFFDKTPYTESMGWSFNPSGSEAHNTCWYTNGAGVVMGCHYKLTLSQSTASLEMVSEGRLIRRSFTQYPTEITNYFRVLTEETIALWCFDRGATQAPAQVVSGTVITTDVTATVFVCHIAGVLHKVKIDHYAYSATRDFSALRPHIGTLSIDGMALRNTGAGCYWENGSNAGTDFRVCIAYGACSDQVRDGYMVYEMPKMYYLDESSASQDFHPALLRVALPSGVLPLIEYSDTTAGRVGSARPWEDDGPRGFSAAFSMYGPNPHYLFNATVQTSQFPADINEWDIAGGGLSGETVPASEAYNFIGYL